MAIPSWLVNAAGAMQFANNPANGFQPTMGDVAQGIGHSMMEHYRAGGMAPPATGAPAAPAPSLIPQQAIAPMSLEAPAVPLGQVQLPQVQFAKPAIPGLSEKSMGLISDLFK